MFYRLSMPLYRTWAVRLQREPLPLPHSLSSLLLRNVFPTAPLLSFRYALWSHIFFRPFPPGLSATSVCSAHSALCLRGLRKRPTNPALALPSSPSKATARETPVITTKFLTIRGREQRVSIDSPLQIPHEEIREETQKPSNKQHPSGKRVP